MAKKISQAEVYKKLVKHYCMSYDGALSSEKVRRLANIFAVKHTWRYFNNNQDILAKW